ncbi:histidine phosphatase family protein [Mangrovibacillus cuniculi]|uniref:Histidine phosphatase family protein n=1 Tax=Mangrovibacillus cuniculi TaxID=2593652 RepID=A0A7S8C9G2_9BACI|nr:histidine phosphatase family protein [Mangrovibacillus cuniculi]QPC45870.1 histidine phosphatase family protein [Mangrovibacillus cuniculi]
MIYIIRHGQTDLNKERRMQGRNGLPLNETGIQQAAKLKEELKEISFDLVFSSPQERAIQTAEIVTGMQVSTDLRLDVFDLGDADRILLSEVKMDGPIPDRTFYKGVENPISFLERVFDFMSELEKQVAHKEINILLSGHRCTTGCMGAYFEGVPSDGNITRFSSETGNFKVFTFNRK